MPWQVTELLMELRTTLEYFEGMGVYGLRNPPGLELALPSRQTSELRPKDSQKICPVQAKTGQSLEEVRLELGDCQRCTLAQGRQHLLFGEGAPDAELLIICQAPGAEEEQQQHPVSGEDRQLLSKMLQAIHLRMEDVYVTNIVKCAPPAGTTPTQQSVKTCLPFLHKQITAVNPLVVLAFGAEPGQALLATDKPLVRLRGKAHEFCGIPFYVTYHPAFLRNHPEMKKATWHDLQMAYFHLQRLRKTR